MGSRTGSDGEARVLAERLRACEAERDAVRKEMDLLSYAISHDLRAPLRAIDGFSEALEEECAEAVGEDGRQYLARVRAAARRMVAMIDGLLELSRLARVELHPERVDLSALARKVAARLGAREAGRTVDLEIEESLHGWGDACHLEDVLEWLFENAWKFTRQESNAIVEFGSSEIDGKVAYFVRDNGVGFDMAFAAKLFAPFQRLHAPSEFPGQGLGLVRAQRIIQRHGGRVWAEARAGEGATFFFTLGGAAAREVAPDEGSGE